MLDAKMLRQLIRISEYRSPFLSDSNTLALLREGRSALVHPSSIRMGQTRLSFMQVGEKLDAMVDELRSGSSDGYRGLLRDDAITGIVGPSGRYIVAIDGNHKLAALRALDGLIATSPLFKRQRRLFASEQAALIPVRVSENASHTVEPVFWRRVRRQLFLERLDGTLAARPPVSVSEAEDDLYRLLAVRVRGRARSTRAGVRITGASKPLWIKLPDPPPFVEFEVGAVLAATLERRRTRWDGVRSLTRDEVEACRAALLHASLPGVLVGAP